MGIVVIGLPLVEWFLRPMSWSTYTALVESCPEGLESVMHEVSPPFLFLEWMVAL